jgi:hypothetical protein
LGPPQQINNKEKKGHKMTIAHYDVRIEGIYPLICNRFHEEAQAEATQGIHSRGEKPSPEEDAENRLYKGPTGEVYFPAENLRQSFILAASRHKIGRRAATMDAAAALAVSPDAPTLIGSWHVDSRAVVIPSTKGRILRHRPMFDKWAIEFRLEVNVDLFDPVLARRVVDDAGAYVGIGDFRPQRRGPYGKFHVTRWELIP